MSGNVTFGLNTSLAQEILVTQGADAVTVLNLSLRVRAPWPRQMSVQRSLSLRLLCFRSLFDTVMAVSFIIAAGGMVLVMVLR